MAAGSEDSSSAAAAFLLGIKSAAERREQLAKREREEAIRTIEKAGLLRLPAPRLEALTKRIKALGIEEVERRLAA